MVRTVGIVVLDRIERAPVGRAALKAAHIIGDVGIVFGRNGASERGFKREAHLDVCSADGIAQKPFAIGQVGFDKAAVGSDLAAGECLVDLIGDAGSNRSDEKRSAAAYLAENELDQQRWHQ